MKQIDRDALKRWEELKASIHNATTIDESMSAAEIEKHRRWLEAPGNEEEWERFFFPNYAKYPSAPFQRQARNRILYNPEWYEVWSWSRELAKSTKAMMAILRLVLTGKKRTVILASATEKSAARLLTPFRINLESNRRIIQYYGEQKSIGDWAELEFKIKQGAAFYGVGAGNAPRGARNEAVRPDVILVDDYDTDEECRNPDVLNNKWDWLNKALIPTRSVSEPLLLLVCGNIIAEECCVKRAGEKADHWSIVNIRDKYGRSTWPEKNSEEMIDRVLSTVSKKAQQSEYFNNPISEGTIFGARKYGKIPSLHRFPFLVVYADPTQSEAKGTTKNKKGSMKAVWLMGKLNGTLYIIKGFLGKMTTEEFVSHFFSLYLYSQRQGRVPVYFAQENNPLQDPFFQQVFKKAVARKAKETGIQLSVTPDEKKKTDKAVRIEANLEPLDREGLIVLNEAEAGDPNMKELDDQFKYFTMALTYPADGPDCIEGGNRFIDDKLAACQPIITTSYKALSKRNKYRQ